MKKRGKKQSLRFAAGKSVTFFAHHGIQEEQNNSSCRDVHKYFYRTRRRPLKYPHKVSAGQTMHECVGPTAP